VNTQFIRSFFAHRMRFTTTIIVIPTHILQIIATTVFTMVRE
jgi:hypothetical protein